MTHADRIKKAEEHERFAQVLRQKDGTVIQFKQLPSSQWTDVTITPLKFDGESTSYRLKPEPKYRPMTEEDFVGYSTVWMKIGLEYFIITKFSANYLYTHDTSYNFGDIIEREDRLYSIDGRLTWHRFRVEVAE